MVPVINPDADTNDPNYEFNKFGFTSVTDAYNPVAFAARTFNTTKVFRSKWINIKIFKFRNLNFIKTKKKIKIKLKREKKKNLATEKIGLISYSDSSDSDSDFFPA